MARLLPVIAASLGAVLLSIPLAAQRLGAAALPAAVLPPAANVAYVPNVGQWDQPPGFVARFGATTAFVGDDGIRISFVAAAAAPEVPTASAASRAHRPRAPRQGAAVHLRFVGAGPAAVAAVPATELSGRHAFFVGDPSRWRADATAFGAVTNRWSSILASSTRWCSAASPSAAAPCPTTWRRTTTAG